jgi:transposase
MPGKTHKRYPPSLKELAVGTVAEIRRDSECAALTRVAELLGVGAPETVRKRVRQAQVDSPAGNRHEESAEVRRLKRESAELKRGQRHLDGRGGFLGAELDRPSR